MKFDVIVTRHPALVEYVREIGLADNETEVVAHATPENIKNKFVCGVLPHSLSCLTSSFTEIPLSIPAELRGIELSVAQIRQYAGPPVTYIILQPAVVGDDHNGRAALNNAARDHYGRPCQCGSGIYWAECPVNFAVCG